MRRDLCACDLLATDQPRACLVIQSRGDLNGYCNVVALESKTYGIVIGGKSE